MSCKIRVRRTLCSSLPLCVPVVRKRGPLSNEPYPSGTFIHILDQDSLLHIFYLCRPAILDEDVTDDCLILQGGVWARERWWHKLAQVCRRWRYLVLGSAHHLRLSLVCSRGTPVAEMLENSPPFPLIIDHVYNSGDSITSITTEDEEGIMLALKHRDRVRRIRLDIPVRNMQRVIMALENEFLILEFLCIGPPTKRNIGSGLMLPKSLHAPHLRHLKLWNFAFPIGSPLLMTAVGLVALSLNWISPSAYFHPNDLVHRLSQMPQLETLGISFNYPFLYHDANRELLRIPPTTHVALPNLRWFGFGGPSAYLEALLPFMTAPLLAKLQVMFSNEFTFHLPHLLQFLITAENMTFSSATVKFLGNKVSVWMYPYRNARMYALYIHVGCEGLDRQVASTAQIFSALRSAFSAVENLTSIGCIARRQSGVMKLTAHNGVTLGRLAM